MHTHNVVDTDIHYRIDGVTRTITNINETKRELVQNDHNSERLTFDVPRYVDGHDMCECNVVQIHYANLDKFQKSKISGVYIVDDIHVKEGDDKTVALSWLVSGHATQYVGTLNFSIRFSCVRDSVVQYAWNTTVFKGISILEAIYTSEDIVAPIVDSLEYVKNEIAASIFKKASGHWETPGTITCGFKPDVVYITGSGQSTGSKVWYTAMPYQEESAGEYYPALEATDTGFIVNDYAGSTFNEANHIYHYLAVKFG